jgi:phage anti-repressor protein
LYEKLSIKSHFPTWVLSCVGRLGLIEGFDYFPCKIRRTFVPSEETGRKEYFLTENAAKMILASENSAAGTNALRTLVENSYVDIDSLLPAMSIPAEDAPLFLYAIEEVSGKRVKLGISADPFSRLKQLQRSTSKSLRLVDTKPAPNGYKDESRLHKKAQQYRVHGEWFSKSALSVFHSFRTDIPIPVWE